jgi:transposase-like protein
MGQLRPAEPTSQSDKQKFPKLDKFDGIDRTKLKLFLRQLHTKFKGSKVKFSKQKHRILYAVRLLRGGPQQMAINLYDEDDDNYP